MIRRILIIEDRKIERDEMARVASEFGTVETAASLVEAQAALQHGPAPGLVLSDLHLHDGHGPIEVATAVHHAVNFNQTRLVFMTTDTGDIDLVRSIRDHFPSIRLVQKSHGVVRSLLRELREDESGSLVRTMDADTRESRESIRAIVKDVIAEMLGELELTWFDIKMWAFGRKKRLKAWDRLAWAVGPVIFTTLLTVVLIFVGNAILTAMREGLQP